MNSRPSERPCFHGTIRIARVSLQVAAIARLAASAAAAVHGLSAFAADNPADKRLKVVAQATASTASAPTATTLRAVSIRDGKAEVANQTIVIAQGAQVEVQWRSDRPIALHLHGYDIETKVTPPATAVMAFAARLAGRFPVTEHRQDGRHHRAVAYLEVRP